MPISTIQILKYVQQYAIRWIVIYPVDSAIRRLNNRGLVVTFQRVIASLGRMVIIN